MTASSLPAHEDMVEAIVRTYSRATLEQRDDGRNWYPLAGRIVQSIAEATGTNAVRIAYALAALSPRNPWRWNVADAYRFAAAHRAGEPMPSATTFKRNWHAAWRALDADGQPWVSAARKVTAFVAAINGDPSAVVIDVWAYRIAVGRTPRWNAVKDSEFNAIVAAYEAAARALREEPRAVQAITWLVAQSEGLASKRVGRHDLAFKAGTPDFVKALLA